jgi:hypothetical protein
MKARQIAIAPNNVYALGPADEVSFIERGADGLWGRWQATGGSAKSIVHGGQVIATIGLDDRLSAFQLTPRLPGFTWDIQATELTVAHLPDGAPVLFAVDGDDLMWYAWKPTPSSPWSDWQPLDGPVTSVAADRIPGGGLVVFGIRDGVVYHRWQDRPLSAWKGWTALEGPPGGAKTLGVTTITHGGLVVFALGGDNAVYHRWQDKPFGAWHEWESLGGAAKSFAVAKSPAGGLALFAIGMDDEVQYRYQSKPSGEWSRWIGLLGKARSIAAQMSYADGLEVFTIGMNDEVYHKWCDRLDSPWTEWALLDHEASAFRLARDQPARAPSPTDS